MGNGTILSANEELKNLNKQRGVMAVEIILGHIFTTESMVFMPLVKFTICAVAFFFFVSAYGMVLSYHRKPDYLNGRFLIQKPLYVLLLGLTVYAISAAADFLVPFDLGYVNGFSLYSVWTHTNWYVWEMAAFYVLFWLIYKFAYKCRIVLGFGAAIALMLVLYFTGHRGAWIASSLAFPIGILYAEKREAVRKFLCSPAGIAGVVLLAVGGAASLLIPSDNLVKVLLNNAICLAVLAVLIYISKYIMLDKSRICLFLNKYSTELYFTQFIWLEISYCFEWSFLIRGPFVMVGTFLTAIFVFHPIVGLANRLTSRKAARISQ